MYYVVFNPLSGNVNDKKLRKLERYFIKHNYEYEMIDYVRNSIGRIIEESTVNDYIVLVGGDGTINHFLSESNISKLKAPVLLYKAGSGNDFAREHKGFLLNITREINNAPYYIIDDKKRFFVNGVGMGIDAAVCAAVNNRKDGSYFKTAVNIFKTFKSYKLEIIVDGKKYFYNDVFFFVAMNGKYIGGGMKIAPEAVRDDGILEVYIIKAKSYKKIIPIFPLIYLGLHKLARKNVVHLRGREITANISDKYPMQADGEVINDLSSIKIYAK